MALYQVVEQNGQKSLIDVAAGGGSVAVPAPYNTETWITESGTWTAPVAGWYDLFLISGGNAGNVIEESSRVLLIGGSYGNTAQYLVYFTGGEVVDVLIGAGAIAQDSTAAGYTSFGDFSSILTIDENNYYTAIRNSAVSFDKSSVGAVFGSGPGGGHHIENGLNGMGSGRFYGAGGAVLWSPTASERIIGNGAPGAARLRYYDPNKTSTN